MENNQGKKRYEQDGSERSREGRRPRIGSKPSGDGTFSNRSGATRPSYGERQQIRDDRNGGMNRTRTEGGYESRNRSYQSGTGRSNEYDRNRGYRSQSGGYNRSSSDTNRPQRNNRYDNNRSDNSGYRGGNDYNRRSNDQRQDGGYQRDGERSQYGRGDYQGERNNRDRGGYNNTRGHGSNFGKPFRKFENRSDNYNPNDKYSKRKQIEYKQQYIDYTKPMRLNKFMANAGICSRREADEFIQAGVVTVNGEPVTELGAKIIPATDKIMFHDQLVRSEKKVYILLNKPKDCVTTAEDTHARTTVLDLVKNACSERIYPVGRLDRNTTGVLLITNDGDLTSKLTHPKYDKKKIYHVVLDRDLEAEDFEKLAKGIELEDGPIQADEISYVNDEDHKQVGIEIHSGKNRIVRRMFDHLGYRVMRLDRVYFAGLTKKNLPRGKWRYLSEAEVNMLKMSN